MTLWLVPVAYLAVFVLLVRFYRSREPDLARYPPRTEGPRVSVIIPARNEAANIERCLRSVLATARRDVEVIVVDDRSDDGTAAIAARVAADPAGAGRLRVIAGVEPPSGWFGKQWALVQGYRAAAGDLLLFTDADTTHHPELLPRAARALEDERVDLVTVLARQETVTFWERLIQPHVFLALGARVGDFRRVNRTRRVWDGIANGQFILTPRAAYEAVGTHAAVRGTVADDVALAQAYVRAGRDIFLVHGTAFLVTRMYRSLRQIVEGWSKNLALGGRLMMPPVAGARALFPALMWLPSLVWIVPPLWWAATGAAWAAATTGISVLLWAFVLRAEGVPVRYALLYPVGAACVAAIMIRSALRGRRVEWRGRRYEAPREARE